MNTELALIVIVFLVSVVVTLVFCAAAFSADVMVEALSGFEALIGVLVCTLATMAAILLVSKALSDIENAPPNFGWLIAWGTLISGVTMYLKCRQRNKDVQACLDRLSEEELLEVLEKSKTRELWMRPRN
jgi:hypothetical protein